jgi:hypothetical protein
LIIFYRNKAFSWEKVLSVSEADEGRYGGEAARKLFVM